MIWLTYIFETHAVFQQFFFQKIINFVQDEFFKGFWHVVRQTYKTILLDYCSVFVLKIGIISLIFQYYEEYPLFQAVLTISELDKADKIFNTVLPIQKGPQAFLGFAQNISSL